MINPEGNKVFADEKIAKINFANRNSKTAKITEIKTVKGQFFNYISELKHAKYNFWLEKAEFQVVNHRLPELLREAVYVIDGGALLHLVQWLSNITYSGVIKKYREYLLAAFGPCNVLFDGYDYGSSTKDIKDQVWGAKLSQVVTVDLRKKVSTPQEKFLRKGKNKTILISFLRDNLR